MKHESSYPSFDPHNARENPNEQISNNQAEYPSFNPNHAREDLNPTMNRRQEPSNTNSSQYAYSG